MKKIGFIPGILAILFLACEKEGCDEVKIAMGSICGWCAQDDSLFISAEKTHYEFTELCATNHSTDKETDHKDWDELMDLLDIREFEKINLNTCFSCVDGCDTWICITHHSGSHQIRFAYFDSIAVQNIQPFINKLETIRSNIHDEVQD